MCSSDLSLAVSKEYLFPSSSYKPSCDTSIITICTIEIWLAHKHKKQKKELRGFLKSKSIKVLHHTIQFWRPKGGHPPTNIAIGSAVSAEDARMAIDFALKYNDRVDLLVLRPRSEEHTSELQSRRNLVCRLLLEKKKKKNTQRILSKRHT